MRTLLLLLLLAGFAGAYLWDGYVGYPRKNGAELLQLLGRGGEPVPPPDARVTAAAGQQLAADVRSGELLGVVSSKFGEPAVRHGDDVYYLGPGGWLKVTAPGGRIASAVWVSGGRTESDLVWQRGIGFGLSAAAILAALQLVRVMRARLTLSDDALQVSPRTVIPLSAISAVRADPAGCVDVAYDKGGRGATLRLDPYIYKNIGPVVEAICDRRGFAKSS